MNELRATPAHASESFEWRIRQHSAEKNSPVNCFSRGNANGSRFSASELRHSKAKPRFCLNAVKRESSKKRGGAAENCFIFLGKSRFWLIPEARLFCPRKFRDKERGVNELRSNSRSRKRNF